MPSIYSSNAPPAVERKRIFAGADVRTARDEVGGAEEKEGEASGLDGAIPFRDDMEAEPRGVVEDMVEADDVERRQSTSGVEQQAAAVVGLHVLGKDSMIGDFGTQSFQPGVCFRWRTRNGRSPLERGEDVGHFPGEGFP